MVYEIRIQELNQMKAEALEKVSASRISMARSSSRYVTKVRKRNRKVEKYIKKIQKSFWVWGIDSTVFILV